METYKKNRELINSGDYYRILSPYETNYSSWRYVSADKTKALLYLTVAGDAPVTVPLRINLSGLDENQIYSIKGKNYSEKTLMNYEINITVTKYENNFILKTEAV